MRFSPIKLIKLQINYKSFLEYLKDLGFTIAFYDVDCFKGNNKTDIISKCIFRWELSINSINKVCIESLVNLSNIEDTNSYENLINLCISHLEFINKLKFIRSSNYLKNNPIEQIFNKYSNKLINQIQLYKFSIYIRNNVCIKKNKNSEDTLRKLSITGFGFQLQKSNIDEEWELHLQETENEGEGYTIEESITLIKKEMQKRKIALKKSLSAL